MLQIAITLLNKLSSYRENSFLRTLRSTFTMVLSEIMCVYLNFVRPANVERAPQENHFLIFFNHIIHDCVPPIYHYCGSPSPRPLFHHPKTPSFSPRALLLFPTTIPKSPIAQNRFSALISTIVCDSQLHVKRCIK